MKQTILILAALLLGVAAQAQRQNVAVGKDGTMTVDGQFVAYVETEGCGLLSGSCQFFFTDQDDNLLITVSQRQLIDKDRRTREFPDGTPELYLVFSFKGFEAVAETDCPFSPKAVKVARTVARWHLIRDGQLDPEAVGQFIAANGTRFSEKEARQNGSLLIDIIQKALD